MSNTDTESLEIVDDILVSADTFAEFARSDFSTTDVVNMIVNHLAVVIKRDDHVNTLGEMFLEKEIVLNLGRLHVFRILHLLQGWMPRITLDQLFMMLLLGKCFLRSQKKRIMQKTFLPTAPY